MHPQKIVEETFLIVSALDCNTLQCPKKFGSIDATKLVQSDMAL